MSFEDVLNTFQTPEEFNKKVRKSTQGEADEILMKATNANDRGLSLSPYERAVLSHHYGDDILEDPGSVSSHFDPEGNPVLPNRGVEVEFDENSTSK